MNETEENSSRKSDDDVDNGQKQYGGGAPILFMSEKKLFGDRIPTREEWLKHEEMYESISKIIEPTHITGLQRVRGMWRIYVS